MIDHTQAEDSAVQIREVFSVLRRRKWTIGLVTLTVFAAALLISFQQTPIYQSETEVLVTGLDLNPLEPGATQPANLETERRLATSSAVAERAAESLGDVEAQALLASVSVQAPRETEILILAYDHPDPLVAQERAQAMIEAYLEFRRQQALDELLATSESVQQRIDDLTRDLRQLNRQLNAEGLAPTDRSVLEAQSSSVVSQVSVLQQQLAELTPPDELRVGQIVKPATLPDSPVSPNHLVTGGLAFFLGLALGIALAFLRERLDDRLRGRDDLEGRVGAPVLAVIPRIDQWKNDDETRVASMTEPTSIVAEAYRTLRTSLLFAAAQEGMKAILVTSAHPRDGKTTTVANLGVVLASAGKRVALVSADLRRPRLHRFFEVPNDVGLTSVLTEETDAVSAVRKPGVAGLGLLPSGPIPGNPAELLGSEAMERLLDRLREIADFVLIDSAPVLAVADATILAPLVDGVLLVADAQNTARGAVGRARQQLDQVNARVVGAVLNNYDPSRDGVGSPYRYVYTYAEEDVEVAAEGDRRGRRRGR